jgi:ABC-type uncharacterized transport system ATPase subunit
MLLDEPASGFPENELPELGELIKKMAGEAGVVVIARRHGGRHGAGPR